MEELGKAIGYTFRDEALAKTAMTHSSYANENGVESYERLEFLGDAVLSVVVSEYLYRTFPAKPEGELTKIRAAAVCERSLHEVAKRLELGRFLRLNKGEELTGGRERISILADVVEATIAAIFLDAGMDETKAWIMKHLRPVIDKAVAGKAFQDYKTELQELAQGEGSEEIRYIEVAEDGPAHMRQFTYEVRWGNVLGGRGTGATKKEAEQKAAKAALEKWHKTKNA